MPDSSDNYQLPSWPPTAINRDLWNAVMGSIGDRLRAREELEADFEALIAQGTQASLDYIQATVAPQIASLQTSIELAQEQINQIIVDGIAPNAAKLGGQLPAYYAPASALPLKADVTYVDSELLDLATAIQLLLDQKAGATETANALSKRTRVDAAQSFTLAEQGRGRANIGVEGVAGLRNAIINGNGGVRTRVAESPGDPVSTDDDMYGHDQHYVLAQTGAVTFETIENPVAGVESMMRLKQVQASAQRFGYAQPIEAKRTYRMRGRTVTLGGKMRVSASQPIRFAVLEWTGTADVLTSDVVNNWASTSYTPGGFFISGNLVVRAVGSVTPTANTVTDWSLVTTIGVAANNIIVLYWTEGVAAQNFTIDQRWFLVEGDASQETDPFPAIDPAIEEARCQRFWWRGLPLGGANYGAHTAGVYASWAVLFPVKMRAVPSVGVRWSGTVGGNSGNPTVGVPTEDGCRLLAQASAANTNAVFTFGAGDYIEARAQL